MRGPALFSLVAPRTPGTALAAVGLGALRAAQQLFDPTPPGVDQRVAERGRERPDLGLDAGEARRDPAVGVEAGRHCSAELRSLSLQR